MFFRGTKPRKMLKKSERDLKFSTKTSWFLCSLMRWPKGQDFIEYPAKLYSGLSLIIPSLVGEAGTSLLPSVEQF
jgi:hypothetical protein